MRVLLIPPKSNYPHPSPNQTLFGQGFPYIAGALKRAGHEVFGLNIDRHRCPESAASTLEQSLQQALATHRPDLIGVGGLSGDYSFVRDAIQFARRLAPNIPIVCGGGIVTYDADFILPNLRPDYAVLGEGERAIVELADALERAGSIDGIANIAYWAGDQPRFSRSDPGYARLEDLPLPDYTPFEYEPTWQTSNPGEQVFTHTRHHPRVVPVTLGRSCPFRCTFCCHGMGPKYRERSIDSGLEEIASLYRRYRFNMLIIYDELFSVRRERVLEFCRKIQILKAEQGMDFDWTCALRVDRVDGDLLRAMKGAGCVFVGYGLESASPSVLRSMRKAITVEQIDAAVKLTTDAGLGVQGNFIFGDFAETTETIRETMTFFHTRCRDLMIQCSYVTPYPGSELFAECIRRGLIADRQQYYRQIGGIASYRLNMTQIPDEVFFRVIDSVALLTDPSVPSLLALRRGQVLAHECVSETEGSIPGELPASARGYRVWVACPHCLQRVSYLCGGTTPSAEQRKVWRVYCPECHKRFDIGNAPVEQPRITTPGQGKGEGRPGCHRADLDGYRISEGPGGWVAVSMALEGRDVSHLNEEARREFQECGLYLRGRSVEEVERLIRETVCRPVPELVDQGYKGFNIVLYKSQYYAMAQSLGPVDLTRIAEVTLSAHRSARRCFTGRSLAEVQCRVDAATERGASEAGCRDAGEAVGDLGRSVEGSTGLAGRAEHLRSQENLLGDRDLAEGHRALLRQGWLEACQSFIRVLQRNRESAEARIGLGHGLLALGDAEEGLAQIREGLRLDPRPAVVQGLATDLARFAQAAAVEEWLGGLRGKAPEAERVPRH